jgi:RibD C-terminal domain
MPKFVVSTTLENLEWNNSRLIKDNVVAEIGKLTQESGQDLLVFGSMGLVHSLMPHDLVDEYRILVYPVVLGGGKRLFTDDSNATLKLAATKTLGSDVVLPNYLRARGRRNRHLARLHASQPLPSTPRRADPIFRGHGATAETRAASVTRCIGSALAASTRCARPLVLEGNGLTLDTQSSHTGASR